MKEIDGQIKIINYIINNIKQNNLQIYLINCTFMTERDNIKNGNINEEKLAKLQELIEQIKIYQPKNQAERKGIEDFFIDIRDLTKYLNLKIFW